MHNSQVYRQSVDVIIERIDSLILCQRVIEFARVVGIFVVSSAHIMFNWAGVFFLFVVLWTCDRAAVAVE